MCFSIFVILLEDKVKGEVPLSMHMRRYQSWGRNDLEENDLCGNVLWGNGIGGETTMVWGRNDQG